MNLLTPGVMSGLIGASSLLQSTNATMALYSKEAAKLNPDQGVMGRALGYVGSVQASARIESEKAGEELEEAQAEAKEKEKAEKEAKLRKESEEKLQARQEYAKTPIDVDTVEISEEGQTVLRSHASSGMGEPSGSVPVEARSGDSYDPKTYTSTGAVQSAVVIAPPAISVSV